MRAETGQQYMMFQDDNVCGLLTSLQWGGASASVLAPLV